MFKTTDNKTYYARTGTKKFDAIFDYLKNKNFNSLLDVGCNNAICSYKIQKQLNKDVVGIDFSDDLELPDDYNFIKEDVSNSCAVRKADVILFLSLYHHMLGCYGLNKADDIFFKLLLSCNELIFDTGNLSETGYSGTPWYKVLEKYFNNEKDLLDHFGVPYKKITSWSSSSGNGERNVVVFKKEDFDKSVKVKNIFQRRNCGFGALGAHYPLEPVDHLKQDDEFKKFLQKNTSSTNGCDQSIFDGALYFKLEIAGKSFFSKKRIKEEKQNIAEKKEYRTTKAVYNLAQKDEILAELKSQLITFYGFSETYGLIFEWLENFEYTCSTNIRIDSQYNEVIELKDVDAVIHNGKVKIFDFER